MKIKNNISIYFIILSLISSSNCVNSQQIKGKTIFHEDNLTVIKLWGTHQERGFAYGYLAGNQILHIYNNYIKPAFGNNIGRAKATVYNKKNIHIDNKYIKEAKAIIKGMKAAKVKLNGFTYIDLLLANSFLDIEGIGKNKKLSNGCSSLMSWGNATKDTYLNSASVVTRHLDWTVNKALIENNLILVHLPTEKDEQPWLMVGYFGQMSVLSGCNKSGLSVFQHMMYDNIAEIKTAKYEPIWFSLRKAIEQKDFDNSGSNDVNDLKAVLKSNNYGYADAYIISALSSSYSKKDSIKALVAEISPDLPYFTFRTNTYEDKITGDNLYAANYPIKRNDKRQYCKRYKSIKNALGKGINIDDKKSWKLLTKNSRLKGYNLQTIQIIPEKGILKLSVWNNNRDAFKNKAKFFDLNKLFKK